MSCKQRYIKEYDDYTYVWRQCVITNKTYGVEVKTADLEAWRNGELAQNAFPYLNHVQREFLITNMTPGEWDQLWING